MSDTQLTNIMNKLVDETVKAALTQAIKLVKDLKGDETPEDKYDLGYRDAIDTALMKLNALAVSYNHMRKQDNG